MRNAFLVPLPGNIELAVTGPKLLYIRRPVDTGTDDILILLPLTRGEAAGAGHIAVAFLVG